MGASRKQSAAALERLACHARCMRRHPTPSELVLWQAIRAGRLGVSFRRQVPVGPYIVDFLAPRERLVVEVDDGLADDTRAPSERITVTSVGR